MNTHVHNQPQNEALFDIGDLLLVIWNKKFRIVFTAGLIFALGAYYTINLPKIYRANATLLVGGNNGGLSLPAGIATLTGSGDSKMDSYIQYIKSRQFAEKLVADNDFLTRETLSLSASRFSEEERMYHAASIIQRGLVLEKLGETSMLTVRFESTSPKLAADIVNAVGPSFFAYETEKSQARAVDASKWLNNQLSQVRLRLESAELELQDYFTDNKLIDVVSQIELARTEISAFINKKIANDEALANLTSMVEQFARSEDDIEGLLSVKFVIENPMVQDVRNKILDEEEDLAEMSKRYKPKHPRYIAQTTKLTVLEGELRLLIDKLISALRQEFDILKGRSVDIDLLIEQAKARHSELGRHEVQIAKLRRKVESTAKLYEIFLSRLQETQILRDLGEQDEFAVIDYASVPKSPSKPQVLILFVAFAALGGFLSVSGWLLLHLVSNKENRYRKLLENIGVPILVEIPKLSTFKSTKDLAKMHTEGLKDYVYSESIRNLRTTVMVGAEEKENRIIAVTGVSPGVGKTSVSISLAESLSKLEKTLLLDIDLRTPSVGKAFGLDKKHPGLSSLISRSKKFSDCLHRIKDSQLSVMPSGPLPQDPIVYLSKPIFASFIQKVGVFYDRLVLDLPSLDSVSDALVVSKNVDGVVLVCDVEKSDSADLLDSVQRLRNTGAPLLGVIFNKSKNVRIKGPNRSFSRRVVKTIFRV